MKHFLRIRSIVPAILWLLAALTVSHAQSTYPVQVYTQLTPPYKKSIQDAGTDCNKLDVIYETIPDFVAAEMPSSTLYAGIESLAGCDISHLPGRILFGKASDTDEEKALLNLLKAIDKAWLYDKINKEPDLIENLIINKIGIRYEEVFLNIISEIAQSNWQQSD
ncbi:MAG: hypothetical protein LBU37_03335, partial [Tannerellaceae bacterium]|nr:hypothetical protein [Tannerellaceae bacterium]